MDSFTDVANPKLQVITNKVNAAVSVDSDDAFPPPKRTKSGEDEEVVGVDEKGNQDNRSAGNTKGAETL